MILPITIIGSPVLRKVGEEIDANYPSLKELIDNMFETMYDADGVGLAAPQIDRSIRLFIVDASPMADDDEPDAEELKVFKKVFINPVIVEETGEEWVFQEGCLSIPTVREDVKRQEKILIRYMDENFEQKEEEYDGIRARIIQHEYDHIEGVLFTDKISAIRKKLIKNKLAAISKGKFEQKYKVKIYSKKR